ncbi:MULTISPECIES: DUF763 domain-containing protein [Acidiplasma]|jgi:hypothetical protein|uniref:DUF763 domain-containing protein n=2 Tax=Acidiplasma TaxID=507753 RepID=A0A0Q0XKS0_9ARCH|nr:MULTISPECIES: DUF763 domain-containing protein [Acidiplasma]KJE48897.1 hypothetical protein TZ01_06370 [Acidiplasma sp. MBA-1]KPV43133.1 hypothetical protein SE19_09050 [Acidiplasma aeolicum]KQB33963.1 hypothetical protein AOG54_01495 [Acidiplasma aeolicum]KQB35784.1 hypothetical protein AOG55_05815 [Acidiplasma cupricumulans]WMT54305.1 MAG: DUF763 domain-containing protein [Acidiplasma sp.]
MRNNGSSIMPLHYGHPPEYLYKRMVELGGIISDIMIENYSTDFFLEKLADPFWFHSLSLAIGFDWNSSGTTTATLSALKEYLNKKDEVKILGGKGRHLNSIREEFDKLEQDGNIKSGILSKIREDSRIIGKIDNKVLQDGFDLYMQFIILDYNGNYAVINQGMNQKIGLARRYHWIKNNIDFYSDKRNGIAGFENSNILDLSTSKSEQNRKDIISLIKENPVNYMRQRTLDNYMESRPVLDLNFKINWEKMKMLYEYNPDNFGELINIKGVDKSTIRALSYLAELVYGDKPSFTDPVKFSFCLGGKDGVPKPVNIHDYDIAIDFYKQILNGNTYYKNVSRNLAKMSFARSGKI